MAEKRIAVLKTQNIHDGEPGFRAGKGLVQALEDRGHLVHTIQIPFTGYPMNSLFDSMFAWRMIDLGGPNGNAVDLVIALQFPAYGIRHPNKVLWIDGQHRLAYDLYESENPLGYSRIKYGDLMKDNVIRFDNASFKESHRRYTQSKIVSERLKTNSRFDSEVLYHPPSLQGEYYLESFKDYVLAVGPLEKTERIDLLLAATAISSSGYRVLVVGNGAERQRLEQKAMQLGVSGRFECLGEVGKDCLLELYANAFAVYSAPRTEAYNYTCLEAFSSGKPVITCNDSLSALEFAREGYNAIVTQPDAYSINIAISNALDNIALCEKLGQNGKKVADSITWDHVVDTLVK